MLLILECKQLQENQAVAWISKSKENNPRKQESLVFLETTVQRVGETAENQRKSREKTKCFGWISAPNKRSVHTPSGPH